MYDFAPDPDLEPQERYRQLVTAVDAITSGETDAIANMANVAALLWEFVPDLNWAGFYRVIGDELVLGPFVGRPACIRITMGQGVCGTAAESGETQLVADVHSFPGHIACDSASQSELVVPIIQDGKAAYVIDLDSPSPARFTIQDADGIEELATLLTKRL
jgi:GAF domain-containing protein